MSKRREAEGEGSQAHPGEGGGLTGIGEEEGKPLGKVSPAAEKQAIPSSLAVCCHQKRSQWDEKEGAGLEGRAPGYRVAMTPHPSGKDPPVTASPCSLLSHQIKSDI